MDENNVNTIPVQTTTVNIPEEYKPISMWGYFGYELLFSLPIIGFIFILIYAFGSGNINRRNFARSYFCFLIIGLVLGLISFLIMSLLGIGFSASNYIGY